MDSISYLTLHDALIDLAVPCDASEWHGVTSAMLCVDFGTTVEVCLRQLTGNQDFSLKGEETGKIDILQSAFVETKAGLADSDLRYSLLLPGDDDASLHERVQALVLWCRGYLFGLAAALPSTAQSDQIKEIIQDITTISMADADNAVGEGDEQSYNELVEYLKVLAISVADELQPPIGTSEQIQ